MSVYIRKYSLIIELRCVKVILHAHYNKNKTMVFGDKKEHNRKYVFKLGKNNVNQTRSEILLQLLKTVK